jgi:hypothetical protein
MKPRVGRRKKEIRNRRQENRLEMKSLNRSSARRKMVSCSPTTLTYTTKQLFDFDEFQNRLVNELLPRALSKVARHFPSEKLLTKLLWQNIQKARRARSGAR